MKLLKNCISSVHIFAFRRYHCSGPPDQISGSLGWHLPAVLDPESVVCRATRYEMTFSVIVKVVPYAALHPG